MPTCIHRAPFGSNAEGNNASFVHSLHIGSSHNSRSRSLALPLLLLLSIDKMAVAGIGPHTIVKGKDTAASAGEPAQQGLDSDTSLVLLKHIPQGKEQLDRIWDAVTDPRHKE